MNASAYVYDDDLGSSASTEAKLDTASKIAEAISKIIPLFGSGSRKQKRKIRDDSVAILAAMGMKSSVTFHSDTYKEVGALAQLAQSQTEIIQALNEIGPSVGEFQTAAQINQVITRADQLAAQNEPQLPVAAGLFPSGKSSGVWTGALIGAGVLTMGSLTYSLLKK